MRVLPATATDALVCGSIIERGFFPGYTVLQCPSRPDFWFGNCVVLEREPNAEQYEAWIAVHARIFAATGIQRHVVVWETAEVGELVPYAGPFVRECSTVFVVREPRVFAPVDVQIREFSCDADWQAALVLVGDERRESGAAEQVEFAQWRFTVCRADATLGRCRFWGAFIGDELAAFVGLYAEAEDARFITPITKPAFRRRGVFAALCGVAVGAARQSVPDVQIITVAARGDDPERIYAHLGFEPIGRQMALIAPVVASLS